MAATATLAFFLVNGGGCGGETDTAGGAGGAGQGGEGPGQGGAGGAGGQGGAGGSALEPCAIVDECTKADACNTAVCENNFCVYTAVPVDDGDLCTADSCDPATGPVHTAKDVNDNNACTADSCDPATGVHNDPITCDDSNACTTDSCNPANGACVFTPISYFEDNFADNSKGWTIVAGEGWAIGPLSSMPYVPGLGFPDPTVDHTADTADNGVAGVYIGTQTANTIHGLYYITSPVINLSSAPTAYLELWRWLNSDYPIFMDSTVEVYNGSSWVTIFSVPPGGPEITDFAWTKFSYDVTAHKNANFRVRFGWSVGEAGVFDVTSWNIDDLRLVANQNCP
jgi:hypothetical protein